MTEHRHPASHTGAPDGSQQRAINILREERAQFLRERNEANEKNEKLMASNAALAEEIWRLRQSLREEKRAWLMLHTIEDNEG